MRVLVNALSMTNISGRHVLLGHLSRLAAWTNGKHEYFILHHKSNKDMSKDLGANVRWIECPGYTDHWTARTAWERTRLPGIVSKTNADLLFTPSGTTVPHVSIPQVSYAMNPWCLVPDIKRKPFEKIKAFLQRRAYKQAMKTASMMLFLSEYLRQAYRNNAGFREKASEVVYTGIDEDIFRATRSLDKSTKRKRNQLLSVSLMAPHKGVETVVCAIDILRRTYGIRANLILAGAWPDPKYERTIRHLVNELSLGTQVEFKGHVPRQELHKHYAESRVFCLMSWCESFGIPAVEAQAFGTPVVSSKCCAIPEVCGQGGVYPNPGDAESVAEHIAHLLTSDHAWSQLSQAAINNAAKYRWDLCSQALVRIFDVASIEK